MCQTAFVSAEAEKLKRSYSALYELNGDIKNYRIKAQKDAEWTALLADASCPTRSSIFPVRMVSA